MVQLPVLLLLCASIGVAVLPIPIEISIDRGENRDRGAHCFGKARNNSGTTSVETP